MSDSNPKKTPSVTNNPNATIEVSDEHTNNDHINKGHTIDDKIHVTYTNKSINDAVTDNKKHDASATKANTDSSIEASNTLPKTDLSLVCDEQSEPAANELKKSGKGRVYRFLLIVLLIAAFLLTMAYQTIYGHIKQPAQEFEVVEGQSYYGLLPQFQQAIPLFSNYLAKFYIKSYVDTPLQAGVYDIPANPTLPQLLGALKEPKAAPMVEVQIIEGKTAKDLYQVLAATPNITLEVINKDGTPKDNLKQLLGVEATTPDGEFSDNLEGWFTPNTYHYDEGVSDKTILTDLYRIQKAALDTAWAQRDADLPYKSPYEALIMASIIEKETSVAEERELVAAVFVNRLNQGMRLQTDPTIIYGMGDRYDGDIRRRDIDEATAYNTYHINGLPPTPIALPSIASIEAAMHPADSEATYFVATGTGGHKFTNTLTEHNKAVQEYLKVMRQQREAE